MKYLSSVTDEGNNRLVSIGHPAKKRQATEILNSNFKKWEREKREREKREREKKRKRKYFIKILYSLCLLQHDTLYLKNLNALNTKL